MADRFRVLCPGGRALTKGTVTYVGSTLGGTPVTGNMDTDRAGEIPTLRFGHMFRTSSNSGVATYLRAGIGGLGRVIGVTASTPNGQYSEGDNFVYLGLGVQAQYAMTSRLVGELSAGYDLMPYSRLMISDGSGGSCGVKLPGKGQITGSMGLNYRISPNIHLVTALDVRQFRFGQSGTFTCAKHSGDPSCTVIGG